MRAWDAQTLEPKRTLVTCKPVLAIAGDEDVLFVSTEDATIQAVNVHTWETIW